jgi:hypothetical protein
MQKIKTLFYAISKSISSVNYYKDLESVKNRFSYKYFLGLAFLLSLILSIGFVFLQAAKIKTEVYVTADLVKKMYEDDLVITMKNGEWALNKPEPYAVNLSLNFAQPGQPSIPTEKKHFIVFAHEGTLDKFDAYDTFVLVNAKNIVTKDSNGFSISPIEKLNIPNGQITKSDFTFFVDEMLTYTKWIAPAGFVIFFVGWILFFVLIKGTNMFVVALPVWLFGLIIGYKTKFKYSEALKITLHTSTLPLIVFMLTKLFNYNQLDNRLTIWVEIFTMLLGIFIVGLLNRTDKVNKLPNAKTVADTGGTAQTETEKVETAQSETENNAI